MPDLRPSNRAFRVIGHGIMQSLGTATIRMPMVPAPFLNFDVDVVDHVRPPKGENILERFVPEPGSLLHAIKPSTAFLTHRDTGGKRFVAGMLRT